jgi:hypothetical protein
MNITFYETHRALHCKEFFTQEEYDEMWMELCFLCSDDLLVNSEKAGGAKNGKGQLLRFNRGLFIESVMDDSSITKYMNKVFQKEIYEEFVKHNENFKLLETNNIRQTNLINHYMGGHSYNFHKDQCQLTAISVFHKTPKPYEGGVLTFRENDSIIEICLDPRDLVIFAGVTDHAVSPLTFKDDVKRTVCKSDEGLVFEKAFDNMNGRISVSKFIGSRGEINVTAR